MKQCFITLTLILILLTASVSAQEQIKTVDLTLSDCIVKTLENNLQLKIQVLSPLIADATLARAWQKFMPTLNFSGARTSSKSPSYSWLDSSGVESFEYISQYASYINQELPTGGNLKLQVSLSETDTNKNRPTINPRYSTSLSLNLTQPLLKGFGFTTAKKEILLARYSLKTSEQRFRNTLLETIYTAEEAYWNLSMAIGSLQVSQQSLELAREQLRKNKRSVEVGVLAPIEIKNAEAEVATREADILQAEASVKTAQDRLKRILNMPLDAVSDDTQINPVDKPRFEERSLDLTEAIKIAFENRPDLEQSRLALLSQKVEYGYSKNQLLPMLNAAFSLSSPGVGGTRILYLNNDPSTGVIIGKIPGNSGDAFKDTFKFSYPNWSLSLQLSLPIADYLTKASFRAARMAFQQSQLQLKDAEQLAILDIKTAVRNVHTKYKQVQAYQLARQLTEKKLEAEEQKLKVGNSTNFQVFLTQRDLANAQMSELRAIIDYNLSLAYLSKSLGITLNEKNIELEKEIEKGRQ